MQFGSLNWGFLAFSFPAKLLNSIFRISTGKISLKEYSVRKKIEPKTERIALENLNHNQNMFGETLIEQNCRISCKQVYQSLNFLRHITITYSCTIVSKVLCEVSYDRSRLLRTVAQEHCLNIDQIKAYEVIISSITIR